MRQRDYPGEVLARHHVGELGRSSFENYTTLERTDRPGLVYAAGGATTVWPDFAAQKSLPLPDWLRGLLQ